MDTTAQPARILLADDDADDRMLIKRAFKQCRLANPLFTVEDGEELMQYLRRQGTYADEVRFPMPDLILLDLNMPRKDGREALQEIKAEPVLRSIPVIVLTTSQAEEDVVRSYDLGVNAFVTKPPTLASLSRAINVLGDFWLNIVSLP